MGGIVFSMMVALGEMVTLFPVPGAHMHFAGRFLDPSLGFALGWNSWLVCPAQFGQPRAVADSSNGTHSCFCLCRNRWGGAISLPTEMSAAAVIVSYWDNVAGVNPAVWIAVLSVASCSFNLMGVRVYGEAEFWFSIIKCVTLIGLLLLGVIITCGGVSGAGPIGFRYWRDPGPFQQENGIPGSAGQFLAFWTTFTSAAYAYLGTENVAMAAAEAQDPRRNVPRAIKRVFWRILVFYVLGVFIMGLIVSPNNPDLLSGVGAAASPWVIAIRQAGIKGLPSVVNAVLITSAWSSGNASLYAASRVLYGLANDGKAPKIFKKCTKNGLPIYCLLLSICLAPLGFMSAGSGSASNAFTQLSNLSSITGLLTWGKLSVKSLLSVPTQLTLSCAGIILWSYSRFYGACKAQGIDRSAFAFKAPFQPYLTYWGLTMIILIVFFNGYTVFLDGQWNTTDFVVS